MIDPRSDRRTVIRFAVWFATVATALWSTMVVLDSNFDTPVSNGIATVLAYTNLTVNFGGGFLTFLIQLFVGFPLSMLLGLSEPVALPGIDLLSWAWILATVFVGAFVQGCLYGVLGLTGLRWCRGRREFAEAPRER